MDAHCSTVRTEWITVGSTKLMIWVPPKSLNLDSWGLHDDAESNTVISKKKEIAPLRFVNNAFACFRLGFWLFVRHQPRGKLMGAEPACARLCLLSPIYSHHDKIKWLKHLSILFLCTVSIPSVDTRHGFGGGPTKGSMVTFFSSRWHTTSASRLCNRLPSRSWKQRGGSVRQKGHSVQPIFNAARRKLKTQKRETTQTKFVLIDWPRVWLTFSRMGSDVCDRDTERLEITIVYEWVISITLTHVKLGAYVRAFFNGVHSLDDSRQVVPEPILSRIILVAVWGWPKKKQTRCQTLYCSIQTIEKLHTHGEDLTGSRLEEQSTKDNWNKSEFGNGDHWEAGSCKKKWVQEPKCFVCLFF